MGGGGSSKGSSSQGDTVVRYAPYLEEAHKKALKEFEKVFDRTMGMSPYDTYSAVAIEDGFFGYDTDGVQYSLKDFPSIYDMFGKFMAGLDVHTLWNQSYQDAVHSPELDTAISDHASALQDEIDTKVMARFLGGMRDINAVHNSSFIIGKSIIHSTYLKAVNEFASKLRLTVAHLNTEIWGKHLSWNQAVITTYADLFKLYTMSKIDVEKDRVELAAKHGMWDINLFEHTRAMLGALGGGSPITDNNTKTSTLGRAIGGAFSGAATGLSSGGGVIGAAVGGILGLASGLF